MKKEFWFGLGAALVSLTISYVLLEVGVSFLVYKRGDYLPVLDPVFHRKLIAQDPPGYTEKPLYECDLRIGASQTPLNSGFWRGFSYPQAEFRNQIFINSDGFRSSQDYNQVRGIRVAVLGDSFVQGLQVREQDTFLKVAEKELRDAGQDVSVLNFGECATGTASQFRIFEEYILKIRPQILVLSFYINDLTDNSPAYGHEQPFLVPHYTINPSGEFVLEDFQCEGKAGDAGIRVLKPKTDKLGWKVVRAVTRVLDKARFSLSLRFMSEFMKDRLLPDYRYDPSFDLYKKVYPPALQESWRFTLFLIDKMHQRCQREGIKFFVILLPAPEQARPALWQQFVRQRGGALAAEDFDIRNPQQKLVQELAARGIHAVDFMPYYQARSGKEVFYYPKDHHFNMNGHRLAGQLLAEQLKQYLH